LTANHVLSGGNESLREQFLRDASTLSASTQHHLWETYGSNGFALLQGDTQLLHPDLPYIHAEIDYLKQYEMATCWEDVLMRRWGLGLRDQQLSDEIKAIKKEAFAS
jgi:glycerol-3-phosphate dehydrogenase